MSKTETQSDALRLASKLRGEAERSIVKYSTAHQSAKELERLDAENKALRANLEAPAVPLVDEREAFEEWARSQPLSFDLTQHGDGYGGAFAHMAWMSWKARGAALAPRAAPAEDALKGVRRYHFVQRSKFGPWIEVERQTAGSAAFVKESDISPQAAAKTGDAA